MRIHRLFAFLFTSVTTGLAAAFLVLLLRPDLLDRGRPPAPPAAPARTAAPPGSYADAVAAAAPSVVNIFATKLTRERPENLEELIVQRFFGQGSKPKLKRENSLGSGVVVDGNGIILTNNHVIEGADEIRIALDDGTVVPARVVGSDLDTDLAVLQAASGELPIAVLGDSQGLRVGDVVLAIGNPFGVGKTVTQGIISALGRHELGINVFEDFIQTDAAINRGNSGGALINTSGEVVGINAAILSQSGGSHGIGFAIPMALAREVTRQIMEYGRVVRGWIGISGQDLTQELAESLHLDSTQGVLVSAVQEDGPADRAGIHPGDVIHSLDGILFDGGYQIMNSIAARRPGDRVDVGLVREGRELIVAVQIGERPQVVK